jgi:hypothetical protein
MKHNDDDYDDSNGSDVVDATPMYFSSFFLVYTNVYLPIDRACTTTVVPNCLSYRTMLLEAVH